MARRKTKSRPARGAAAKEPPPRRYVWRIRHWRLHEPDAKFLSGRRPTPLAYVREWINTDPTDRRLTTRHEIEGIRLAILRAGGAKLYGIWRLLVCYAADRAEGRGYLVDHRGLPASPRQIAELTGLTPAEVGWARRLLAGPQLGLLERVPWTPDLAAKTAPGGPQAPPTGHPGGHPHHRPDRDEASDHRTHGQGQAAEDTPRPPEARAGPPPAGGAAAGAGEAVAANTNGNGNAACLAASGQPAQRKNGGNGHANGARRTGHTHGNARAHADAHGDADAKPAAAPRQPPGPPAADGAAAGRPPTEAAPAEAGRRACPPSPDRPDDRGEGRGEPAAAAGEGDGGEAGSRQTPTEAAPAEAGGDGRPPSPGRPDVAVECERDGALWAQLAGVTTWERIADDDSGAEFGKAVYYALGLPMGRVSARAVRREVGSFRAVWGAAAKVLPGGYLLDLAERSLRHAMHLAADPPAPDPAKPGARGSKAAVWVSEFHRRATRAVEAWTKARGAGSEGGPGPPGPTP